MRSSIRRFAVAFAVSTGLVVAGVAVPATAAEACPYADARAGQVSNVALGRATHCLVNRERERRGLRRLRGNWRLSLAARRHSRDMVRRSYFAHLSLSGTPFERRVRGTGYLRSVGRWTIGENIAWGGGRRSSPRMNVRAWMESPSHRRNVLARRFRELGVGVVSGAPVSRHVSQAATYAHEFGAVSR